jgi:hypothetical protein
MYSIPCIYVLSSLYLCNLFPVFMYSLPCIYVLSSLYFPYSNIDSLIVCSHKYSAFMKRQKMASFVVEGCQ